MPRIRLTPLIVPLLLSALIHPMSLSRSETAIGWQVNITGTDPISSPVNTSGLNATFSVTNNAGFARTATLSCAVTGPLTCGTATPSSYSFDVGETIAVNVSYSTGSAGTGTVGLRATGSGAGGADHNVNVAGGGGGPPPGVPVVALRNQNDDNQDRSLCLTAGAGPEAAYQCGDLLVSRSTPSYATMGKERAVTLVYTSAQALPQPYVVATVTQSPSQAMPTAVFADFQVNTGGGFVSMATSSFTAWDGSSVPSRQIGLYYRDSTSASGIYPFQLLVQNQYPSGNLTTTVSGNVIIVNRYGSRFGRGWAIAGVEELVFNQPVTTATGDILWIGADGSAKRYGKISGTQWVAPLGGFRDTLVYNSGDQTYTRTLRHGVKVVFDALGRHIKTVGRTGQQTSFNWNGSGQLTGMTVPPAGASNTTYTIAYTGGGDLDYITDPAGRTTQITITAAANWLSTVTDVDGWSTQYAYDNYGRMSQRMGRNIQYTNFTYIGGRKLGWATILKNGSVGDTIVYQPWDTKGMSTTGGSGIAAVDTALAYTKILGPRVGVADDASFWIDRWGSPVRSMNALGQVTTLVRGDAAVPALVTRINRPDSTVGVMSYNARGNLIETRDSSYSQTNPVPVAVNSYTYNSPNTQDAPDNVTDPEGVVTQFKYNTWGLDSLAIAPNGHVTRFEYVTTGSLVGLMRAVTELSVPVWDSTTNSEATSADLTTRFGFNPQGNVVADTSPMGRIRSYVRDTRQLVTTAYDAGGYRKDYVYDDLNRMTKSITHGELAGNPASLFPADSGISKPDTTIWTYTKNVVTQVRDPRGVARSFTYDYLDRQVVQIDDYGNTDTTFYNAAGQVDSTRARTGHKVRNYYDAGGRLTKTRWETRQQNGDSVVYSYDPNSNRMLTAQRFYLPRKTTRTYYSNGLLKTEQDSGAGLFRHAYTYDRAGKRMTYVIGAPASTTANDSIAYRYNNTTGDLARIYVRWRHPSGNTDPVTQDSVRFAWDGMGRRDTVAFTTGQLVRLAYDADGNTRVVCGYQSIQSPPTDYVGHSAIWNQWIDPRGQVRRVDYVVPGTMCGPPGFQGSQWNQTYDVAGQMLNQTFSFSGWKFRYDRSGNMVKRNANDGSDNNTFTIDPGHNRLTRHDRNGSIRSAIAYDNDGARAQECPNVPNPNCSVSPGYREYHYDGLGRTAGTWDYACTSFLPNSMSCGITGSGSLRVCGYDAVGRMDFPCESGADAIGFDGSNVTRTHDDASVLGWTFVHGPGTDDPLLGYYPGTGTGQNTYAIFLSDGAGRQLAVLNRSSGVSLLAGGGGLQQNNYQNNGGRYSGGTASSSTFGPDRFNAQAHSGLTSFRNRFYDQLTGRWTQEDPIGLAGGMNMYQFNGNNPAMFTDPFGLKVEFGNDRAREMYNQLRANARNAMKSRNHNVAQAGRELNKKLDALEADEETVVINVSEKGKNGFGQYSGTSNWGININSSSPSGYSPQVRLAHELGHAYSTMVDGRDPRDPAMNGYSNESALLLENNQRSIWGCSARIVHDTALKRFNPKCE